MAQAGTVINTRDKVEITAIKHADEKKQKLVPGKKYMVHPLTAENLIATGHAQGPDKPAGKGK